MVSATVKVANAAGFELRPAGLLCEAAMKYKCKITFRTDDDYEANAKSVLSVLGACVRRGQEITLFCDGEDEAEALENLSQAIRMGLGE